MSVYISKTFSTPEEFEAWIERNNHGNKDFLDKLCEADKEKWDNKACKMTVKDGKLQLLCEKGNVLAEADYYQPDGDTVCCDGNGELCIEGFKNANDPDGKKFRVWVGTQAEYDAIRVKDPRMMYYITDDTTLDDILKSISNIVSGTTKVGHAKKADHATSADSATKATQDGKGNNIANTYLNKTTIAEPTLNTDKKLTEAGYYYIARPNTFDYDIVFNPSIVYWASGKTCEIHYSNGEYFKIDKDGNITYHNESGTELATKVLTARLL